MKLYINCFATIIDSKYLSDVLKKNIVKAENGKIKRVVIKFKDENGNDVILSGKLEISKSGSLMARCTMQTSSFKVVEINKLEKKGGKDKNIKNSLSRFFA